MTVDTSPQALLWMADNWDKGLGPTFSRPGDTMARMLRAVAAEKEALAKLSDHMGVYGRNADGSTTLIGHIRMSPQMKMRELVRDFNGDVEDDCSDAAMALYALEQFHKWMTEK